jgi:mannose-6-phosphate isomerase-like protein (cupin superfamily)
MLKPVTPPTIINQVKVVPLPRGQENYTKILGGPPETTCLKSGYINLEPGKSVGMHSTNGYEELIVPLEGEGELLLVGTEPLTLRPGSVLYIPPQTAHDVHNTGTQPLKYIYVVAKPG